MSKNLSNAGSCPNCGRPLPQGTLAGLCPTCLLGQAAETKATERPGARPFQAPSLAALSELFPQLEILGLLGAGGMGAVYKARQPTLDRLVALKLLPPHNKSGAPSPERFNREARALARLSHPNIVAVHEFGQVQGQPYFIMEFVDGCNLRQLEKAGRLSPREALQIIPQICDALQYAHDEGVVHRDIKPENVLIDRKGRVKIADFGLAKIVGQDSEAARLTIDGQVMGTPHYMAPEQVEHPLAVDHRADIYSLGVVFYEMLTGDLPIGKFAPPSRKVEVDVRLDEIVLRALENDPERRYQQASEVKHRVSNVMTATPTGSATSSPVPATDRPPTSDRSPEAPQYLRWMGLPLVAERHGEREVYFNGALAAFAVVMLSIALGLFIVQRMAQREHFSASLCFITGVLTVVWAVRLTLNRPAPAPPRRTPQGTLIVSPFPEQGSRLAYLVPVALVAFVIATHFLLAKVIGPWVQEMRQPPLAEVRATKQPETGALIAELPGVTRVALLAVANRGATPKQWWRPDGSLETQETYELRNPVENSLTGRVSKDMIFRLTWLARDVDGPHFESDPAAGVGSGGAVFRDGKPLPDLLQARFAWPPDCRRGTVRLGFTADPWRAVTSCDARGNRVSGQSLPEDPHWNFRVHGIAEVTEGAQVTLIMGKDRREWHSRVVAVDTNGVVHTRHRGTGTAADASTTWTYTFPGLPLAQVQEFRVEVRPVHWIEFKDVALDPNSPVPSPEPLRFGEVMERTFDELIDLDTGRTGTFPSGESTDHPLAALGDNILWAQDQGFDAAAGLGELQILQVNFAVANEQDWNEGDPQVILDRHYQGTFRPRTLGPLPDGKLPVTYTFETREGTLGLLQLVSFDQNRPGATIRIKPVIR